MILDGIFGGELLIFFYIFSYVSRWWQICKKTKKGGKFVSLTLLLRRIPMAVICDVCSNFPVSLLLADSMFGPLGLGGPIWLVLANDLLVCDILLLNQSMQLPVWDTPRALFMLKHPSNSQMGPAVSARGQHSPSPADLRWAGNVS